MSRIYSLSALLLTFLLAACSPGPKAQDVVTISIVGTNDVHGALAPEGDLGGIVAFSTRVDALRAARRADGGAVLHVDAGDMWQGTLESNLSEGAAVVAMYNAMGVTAATLGNHEFDFGPEGPLAIPVEPTDDPQGALKQRLREAQFPVLAANIIDTSTGLPVQWEGVQPAVMVDAAGIKVGIVGVVTSRALLTTIAANTVGLSIAPLAEAITREALQLRANGAALVIVAAHAGGRCEDFSDANDLSSCVMSAEIMRVANDLEPGLVDHIVAGHHHNPIAHVVNGIAITSNKSKIASFGRVDFRVDRSSGTVIERAVFPPQPNPADLGVPYEGHALLPDPGIETIAQQASVQAEALKNQELGVLLTGPFELVPDIESAMSNLMTEAILDSFDADIAIHNVFGGIRKGLPAGELTYGAVYEMFPFDNLVSIHEISGRDLRRIIARKADTPRKAGFAGMRVFVTCSDTGMQVRMLLDDGREISDEDRVRVVANDFLALGGDDILTPAIPEGGFEIRADMPLTRDTLVAWFGKQDDRLDPADFETHSAPKWNVPDTIPAGCTL
ncbi:MAG: bifunctional UDP-sugar hydrolase/5'-nucleotidase [Woeseiaceae bacterium]